MCSSKAAAGIVLAPFTAGISLAWTAKGVKDAMAGPKMPAASTPTSAVASGATLKTVDDAQTAARNTQKKAAAMAAGLTGTVKTSPLGASGVGKSTLG